MAAGVTINGLAIINNQPNPGFPPTPSRRAACRTTIEENVIGGPGAFLLVVENFDTFADAMANKLAKEIDVSQRPVREQVSALP